MGIPTVNKDPDANEFYWIQCAARLAVGEIVTGVISIAITPVTTPPLVDSGVYTVSGTVIQVKFSGGKKNTRYTTKVVYTTSLLNTKTAVGFFQIEEEDE